MKNIKYELFNFRNSLTYNDNETDTIGKIVTSHFEATNTESEKDVIKSLNNTLGKYNFDPKVKAFLESLNDDMIHNELDYELKHLLRVIETKNNQNGMMYREPLRVLAEIVNLNSDEDKMIKILNELSLYSWVPEIKQFVYNLQTNPEQKTNLMSGGKSEPVYTLVESVDGDNFVVYINKSWFLIGENGVSKTLLEEHITDVDNLRLLRNLERAIDYAEINEDLITFRIGENIELGLSVKKKGTILINGEEVNAETTLESLFSSPIIPLINKSFFPIISETAANLDKFYEIDIVRKVTNMINPHLEVFVFNYGDSMYAYRCDNKNGNSLYEYKDAQELINEIRNELNFDLTFFFEDKLDREILFKKQLEDKVREITLTLEEIDYNIDRLNITLETLGENEILTEALNNIETKKASLNEELSAIRDLQYQERIKL